MFRGQLCLTKDFLPCDTGVLVMSSPVAKPNSERVLWFKQLEIEMRCLDLKEKELSELELSKMEVETKRELELKQPSSFALSDCSDYFDIKSVFVSFLLSVKGTWINTLFCLSALQEWPRNVWSLLQCVFTGKAQGACASLSSDLSQDYEVV